MSVSQINHSWVLIINHSWGRRRRASGRATHKPSWAASPTSYFWCLSGITATQYSCAWSKHDKVFNDSHNFFIIIRAQLKTIPTGQTLSEWNWGKDTSQSSHCWQTIKSPRRGSLSGIWAKEMYLNLNLTMCYAFLRRPSHSCPTSWATSWKSESVDLLIMDRS